jgi:hypothetical protein
LRKPEGEITKQNKLKDRCGEFIEGDPKFMNEVEEKKWREDHPDKIGEDKFGIATAADLKMKETAEVKKPVTAGKGKA